MHSLSSQLYRSNIRLYSPSRYKKTCTQTNNGKIEKKYRKKLSEKQLNYQTADKQPQSYVDKCEQIIVAAGSCACQTAFAIVNNE